MKSKILIIIVLFLVGCSSSNIGPLGSAHDHAAFKVYINGEVFDFSKLKYMIKEQVVHIENMDGNVIHKHATGITLGYFFDTLGMTFNDSCFVLDNGKNYCNQDDKTLKFYANGEINYQYGEYEIKNADKYLITYGDDSEVEIQKQLDSVANKAKNQGWE